MIPAQKPCKGFLREKKNFEMVGEIMGRYLKKWNVPCGTITGKIFAEKYFDAMIEKAIGGEVRIVLPHNLGYMQVLEHKYNGMDKEFKMKNNGIDWSLIWMRHPMFIHHRISTGKNLQENVRAKKKEGINFLTEFVDGDTYVVE